MGQFSLYTNPNPASRKEFPYLLDVQTDLLRNLNTRVVIPVSTRVKKPISHLCPTIKLGDKNLVLMTQQLAAIPKNKIGKPVADLSLVRNQIIAALDFLFTGF
ncbi:MAG: CcdB family protein [Gammaproteobacteria bacterium]|nr:CcdB family protein [Gammaproteobacteria bacterium]